MSPKIAFLVTPLRPFAAGSLLVLVLGLSGCAHTYNVKVDALANPNVAAGASYQLIARDAVKADYEPRYAHAVELLESALAARGFFPADNVRHADMVIELDFGIGSQRKEVTEDVGLFGGLPPPTAASARPPTRPEESHPTSGLVIAPEPLPPPPTTRVTVVTLYEKYLSLSARETPNATRGLRKPVELWRITVAVEDAQQTVDECLPVLVVTATDNLGTTTPARTNIRVPSRVPTAVLANNER